ncbi:MAG: helix-turn-helix transcriptional regulator [Coriobacteriales bacterium]|jgi:transcriptional regulator with XRE-family HTH domain|nr:helix-turn-helix transcriptional regulator [Coriobacteriales bacterium]
MLRVERERKNRGFNKSELARRAGIQLNTVSWIESGRFKPYPSQLIKLASALEYQGEPGGLLDEVGGQS